MNITIQKNVNGVSGNCLLNQRQLLSDPLYRKQNSGKRRLHHFGKISAQLHIRNQDMLGQPMLQK
ncbi:MAG: hypothetical protein ACH254_07215, partial [Candidatus Thiodiazotropha endolucinida]